MMDRGTYDPTIEPSTILDRSLREIGRPHRALARRRRRPARLRGHAAVRRLVHGRACCASRRRSPRATGTWWQTHVSEDPGEIAEVARLFPEALDYVDVYDRAGGLGRADRPRPRHPPLGPRARPARRDRHAGRPLPGLEPVPRRRGDAARPLPRGRACRSGSGSDVVGRPGSLDLLGHAGRGLRPDGAPRRWRDEAAPILDPLDWLRLGTLERRARRSASERRIGSLEAGKEADLIAVDPAFVGAAPGHAADDDPADLMSRLIFRAHPDMVRARVGPRPAARLDRARRGGRAHDRARRPAHHRRHDRRRHGRAGPAGHGRRRRRPAAGPARRTSRRPAHVGRTIDATGKVVAPGFIDLHSHGGLMILAEPATSPRSARASRPRSSGSTATASRRSSGARTSRRSSHLDSGLDGRPDIDYDWTSVASYLARYDGTVSLNVAHARRQLAAPDRGPRLGRRARPTPRALDRMRGAPPRRRWPKARSG